MVSAIFPLAICNSFATFLFTCLPGLSLVVSALFRWPCSVSIHLSPRSVTASPPFSADDVAYSIHLSPRSVTFSAGHVALLFICLPGLSLLVSALFRWPCSISIHLSPRSALLVSALFCWRCNISIHLSPGVSLLVSALFRWPCTVSIHLSPRSVTAGVRPFPLAMQHFYSFICLPGLSLPWCPPLAMLAFVCSISIHLSPRSVTGGVRPFPLAM